MNKQQLARENRELAEIINGLAAAYLPVAELTTDVDSFIADREREALKLADSLESGSILTNDGIQKARERLSEITDELARAHRLKQSTKRRS